MKTRLTQIKSDLRIILAIAWKDILDGWKNKIIITGILTSLFLVIFYNYMPELTEGDEPPELVIFYENDTVSIGDFEYTSNFKIYTTTSMDIFKELIREMVAPGLGIVLTTMIQPEKSPPYLQTYVPYWMSPKQVTELTRSVELELTAYWDQPVNLVTNGNLVYQVMESNAFGKNFIATAGLILGMILMGLSMAPQLIIEEKDNKTIQAVIVSPASLSHFIAGKALAVSFYTSLVTGIGLIFIRPLVLNWELMLLALFVGMMTVILPGILIGVLLQTKQQVSIWIWVLMIPTILPLFFSIVRILPETLMMIIDWWPTVALYRLIQSGFSYQPAFSSFRWELVYLLTVSLIFFGLTVFSINKQSLQGE
jgi:ABC-2 type transport system permease protein